MPDYAWHWSGYSLAILASFFVLWSLFADRARGRKRCRRCWYDLVSLGEVPITCPECGKAHTKPKHLTRTRRRYRRIIVGLVFLIASYGLWTTPRVIDRGWYGAVPTTGLLFTAPWLPRATIPSSSALQDPNEDFYLFRKRAHELYRVETDTPANLAEELEIRWVAELHQRKNSVPSCLRTAACCWWKSCGALDDLGRLPSNPNEYYFGTGKGLPSILVYYDFCSSRLSKGLATTVAGAQLLTKQPPVWKAGDENIYFIDPGAVAELWWLPTGSSAMATLVVPANNCRSVQLPLLSRSTRTGAFTSASFRITDPNQIIVIRYEIRLRANQEAVHHTVSYKIFPWSEADRVGRRSQWGQAVPLYLNGQPLDRPQLPMSHVHAHEQRVGFTDLKN